MRWDSQLTTKLVNININTMITLKLNKNIILIYYYNNIINIVKIVIDYFINVIYNYNMLMIG